MPIYEYRCPGCGKAFEVLVRKPSDAPRTCPSCGKKGLRKEFSTFAVAAPASASAACDTCPAAGDSCPGGTCCMDND